MGMEESDYMGRVYIVHCVDTEGPLYETPSLPFEMIKNIFGFEIEPTRENLIKLQNGELDLKGQEEAVCELVDIHRITTRGTWEEVDRMLKEVTSHEYRMKLPDTNGNGWIFNWFCMDHAGFTGHNPRRRDAGFHKIYDHYVALTEKQKEGDYIGFHYHPLPLSGNYHESGTAYLGGENLNQILAHKIIDRAWFPSAYRPGFHTERPDSNWFLEQWIPFDYGNQAFEEKKSGQPDMDEGRYGDWRHAPLEWYPYHPAHDDYQSKGSCRRWITRCLNMYARIRQISQKEVNEAFEVAQAGKDAILSFTDHDYKDMKFEIERIRTMIAMAAKKYEKVPFEYADAKHAMRNVLKLENDSFDFDIRIKNANGCDKLIIEVNNKIFGPQPFLALKLKNGRYVWDNLDFTVPGKVWSYSFDTNTVKLGDVDVIGVASNNAYGFTRVITTDNRGNILKNQCYE